VLRSRDRGCSDLKASWRRRWWSTVVCERCSKAAGADSGDQQNTPATGQGEQAGKQACFAIRTFSTGADGGAGGGVPPVVVVRK
jgi:hypothetical protein